ncbi:MAG: OmpW family protein, partial [Pseudomonadota bacterium]|nr:OmpW family protein [Pseudomonadota bacterium]
MKNSLVSLSRVCLMSAAVVAAFASLPAQAQSAGKWSVKVGENLITPEVSSGDLSGPGLSGVKVDINSAYAPQV